MNKKIILIVISAFILRLVALILLGRHINPERWEYDYLAVNLINHNGYIFKYFNTTYHNLAYPGYAFFIAAVHLLTNQNYFILEICQIFLSAITCYFIYLISITVFDKRVGLLACILVATHPGLIIYSTKLSEVTLIIFLISLIFLCIFRLDWSKLYNNIFVGILIGLGMLTRPLIMFFLPVYFLGILTGSHNLKKAVKVIFIVSLSAFFVIIPWTIRSSRIQKRLVFITMQSPELLWRGNNPLATGTALYQDKDDILGKTPKEFQEKIYKMNEIEQHDFFLKTILEFIKANPLFFIKMCIKKFFYFWWFTPTIGILYPGCWTFLYKIYYGLIFIFFIAGFITSLIKLKGIKKAWGVSLFTFCFLTSLLHSVYYIETRHRFSVEPLLLIFSSYGFILLWEKLKGNPDYPPEANPLNHVRL